MSDFAATPLNASITCRARPPSGRTSETSPGRQTIVQLDIGGWAVRVWCSGGGAWLGTRDWFASWAQRRRGRRRGDITASWAGSPWASSEASSAGRSVHHQTTSQKPSLSPSLLPSFPPKLQKLHFTMKLTYLLLAAPVVLAWTCKSPSGPSSLPPTCLADWAPHGRDRITSS